MATPFTKTIPNLIQGVSQQAVMMRRDSQCAAQFDCLNSPKDGAVARHGAYLLQRHDGLDLSGCASYELYRGLEEHYLVTIKNGVLRVYDLETGNECTVTVEGDADDYLAGSGDVSTRFRFQAVEDNLFIANTEVVPAMAATVSASRDKEALVFFRAGNYETRYGITLVYAGTNYTWVYKTPDNSAAANAAYITTGNLAATFYRAFTTNAANTVAYTGRGVGSPDAGDTGGSGGGTSPSFVTSPSTLAAIGFSVEINGNLLRIYRTDGNDFAINTFDGTGDQSILAFKDTAKTFSDLPRGGFDGMVLKIKGAGEEKAADYYVKYVGSTAAQGYWEECVKPNTPTSLDPETMPVALENTGVGTFTLRYNTWSSRIAGDGEDTAVDPGFVGKPIHALFYHQRRLAILTDATCDWSKAKNPFTFFPDTVQTILADAPIGITLAAGENVALLRKALMIDESLHLWAQGVQFRITSGNDPFKEGTVEAPPSTHFEFAEDANFAKTGTIAWFATEPDNWATIRALQFQQGRVAGDPIDVTSHIPEYVPSGVRRLSASDTGNLVFVWCNTIPSNLYLYNFLIQGREWVQSAWNTWRFPEGTILWSSVWRMNLYLVIQRPDGVLFLKHPLRSDVKDPDGTYHTRLDLRVSEEDCTVAFDAETGLSTVTLPYEVDDEEAPSLFVAIRANGGGLVRGRTLSVESASGDTITVKADLTDAYFYAGFRIASVRTESEVYLRGAEGFIPVERLTINSWKYTCANTGYSRVEVIQTAGGTKVYEAGTFLADTSTSALDGPPALRSLTVGGTVHALNTECTISIINDSPLPSRWLAAAFEYTAVNNARPSPIKTG